MHPSLQAKLLQVLQDGHFSRLGGEADISRRRARGRRVEPQPRERRARELVPRGSLLPPERGDDPACRRCASAARRSRSSPTSSSSATPASTARPPHRVSPELRQALLAYDWPGNIRELENLVKRVVVLGARLEWCCTSCARAPSRRALPRLLPRGATELDRFLSGETDRVSLKQVGREAAQVAEARLIAKVLERTRWNRKEAAEILQISYKALLYKMKDAGLAERALAGAGGPPTMILAPQFRNRAGCVARRARPRGLCRHRARAADRRGVRDGRGGVAGDLRDRTPRRARRSRYGRSRSSRCSG